MEDPHEEDGSLEKGKDRNRTTGLLFLYVTVGVMVLSAALFLLQADRYVQRPQIYEIQDRRRRARTGDIILGSVKFENAWNLVNGTIPKIFMATPANHAGLFYSPQNSPDSPIYVLHRTYKGNRIESVLKFAQIYSSILMVKVEPAPPEEELIQAFQRRKNVGINGISLVSLFFNSHLHTILKNRAPVMMRDKVNSCIRMIIEVLEEIGVCRSKVPLDTLVPNDVLFFSDPGKTLVEALPPYSFSQPIIMGPFGGEAAIHPRDPILLS